jgi:type I restriction enzyme S subunit
MAGNFRSKTIPLSKTTKFIVDNRGRTAPTVEYGVPLIATNCISNDLLYPTYEKLRFVTKETYENWFRSHPLPGDIILTNKGSQNGAICLVPDPVDFVIAQDMVALRADEKIIDPLFLFAALRSADVQREIKNLDVSGVIPHFKKTDFDKLHLPYPERDVQEVIGRIYYDFCAKIELNRQMNATLEAMARSLFQSWFVDFDPVRAKLDGREPVGLDPDTAALFPVSFDGSAVGQIPNGWSIKPVGEVVDCVGGGTPSTAEPIYWEGGTHHWTTPKDFSSLQAPVLLDTDRKLTDAGIAKISSGLLPAGTLLLSSRAPVGYLAITAMPVAINQGFIALKCNGFASNIFMLNWCQTNIAEIKSRATGTTFAEISKQNFRPIPVVLPPIKLIAAFTAKAAPLYSQITANLHQSQALANMRDTLLPKLLSRELSVADVALTGSSATD